MFKKKKNKNILEIYNANNAHKEMVIKSGGGINNLFQNLEDANYNIELLKQNIVRLYNENYNMEQKIIELGICYKFKNSFIVIEINRSRFIEIFKKYKQKFKKIFYILNVIQFIKFNNIIILLNLIFFLQHLKLF